jgi:hypothetical protein
MVAAVHPNRRAIEVNRPYLKEDRNDQNRENIDNLDHRIDGRACGIFIRIAHGITGNGRLVREGTFASEVSFLDEFLGVVPCAAA